MPKLRILFVCLGNICRSPLAEGILRHVAAERGRSDLFEIDSAGTGGWHIGDPPDPRTIAVARRHGIDISDLRGRKLRDADFDDFDLLLALDRGNLHMLTGLAPPRHAGKIQLFARHALRKAIDVPDPYYGAPEDFEAVFHLLYSGCSSIVGDP
ncbi:MAG: low molecular weight protein-tyrosine-phosphatase [Shinella sp.]|jgi:protein-tyrosine phosphatase|nr:low molecular weight protein-tyrosine-phosphatase [Shinella sp.]